MDGAAKSAWQTGLAILGLGLLAVPVLGVSYSGAASSDALWTTLRLTALEGFTLVFIDTLIGALRPLLNKVFKPRTVHRLHVTTGLTGISLVIGHAIMLLVFGVAGYDPAFVWIGPGVITILVVTVVTAFERRKLRRSWRWVHRLNYLAFAAALVHGISLGFDLGAVTWLRTLFLIYGAAVVAAVIYRYAALTTRRSASS